MSRKYRGGKSAYEFLEDERQERIRKSAQRDWDRHPELQAEHGGSFERYMRSIEHSLTYG